MGFKLRREVVDLLPRGGVLTDKECRLILELADTSGDETRVGYPGAEWLADKADIPKVKRVGEFFASIARKWVELRVPLGTDKHGQPYYSRPGRRTEYRFPTRTELEAMGIKVPPLRGPSDNKVPPTPGPKLPAEEGPKVPPTPAARSPQQGDPSPHGSPQRTPSSLSSASDMTQPAVATAVVEDRERKVDASPEDQKPKTLTAIQRLIAKRPAAVGREEYIQGFIESQVEIRSIGWWINADGNGTLDDWIDKALAADEVCGTCTGTGEVDGYSMYGGHPEKQKCPDCPGPAPQYEDFACPIHHYNVWHKCNPCWGDVKAGSDPYHDRETERPDDWFDVYLPEPTGSKPGEPFRNPHPAEYHRPLISNRKPLHAKYLAREATGRRNQHVPYRDRPAEAYKTSKLYPEGTS